MSRRTLLIAGVLTPLALLALLGVVFGAAGENTTYQPQDEFELDAWIPIHVGPLDLSINKAVVYLLVAAAATIGSMLAVARRMSQRPNRVQTAVETAYGLMRDTIAAGSLEGRMLRRWFPFLGTLFLFIWWSNMIGYVPLPTNSQERFSLFGLELPSFALYAATANISVPLALTLVVWVGYHVEGVRAHGPLGYLKSWVPAGVGGAAAVPLFLIESVSHVVRIVSLSVRLFANILAGHLLILFMAGGLVTLLGIAALGVVTIPLAVAFFLFEVGLVATLQAFIFATLAAIYLGGAVAEGH